MEDSVVSESHQEDEVKIIHNRQPENEPWYKSVTVEPALFLLAFAFTLCSPVLQNFVVLKTCRITLGYNETICSNLSHLKEIEDEVQPRTAQLFMFKSLIEAVIPAGLSFYIGPWSDHHGRRPLLLIPVLGYMLMSASYMILTLDFAWESNANYLLLASIPVAFSGAFVAFVTGAFCYISDISSPAERSWRMGLADVALLIGVPMGYTTSSFLLKWGGYKVVFGTSSLFCAIAFVYTFFFVPESIQVSELSGQKRIFDFNLIKDMVRTCCKPRSGYRRLCMFLVMAAMALIIFSLNGDVSVSYLYTREKLGWNIQDYTLYSSAGVIISTTGTLLGLRLFSNKLKIDDAPLAAFSCFMKAVSLMVLAMAEKSWVMYAGSGIGFLGGLSAPLGRAILSKNVHPDDVGKVFSLTSSLEALTPIAAAPLYTIIYKATFLTVPGTFYMLSSGIYLTNFFLLVVVASLFYKYPGNFYSPVDATLPVN